jgi:aminoglycoside/choline kinase family phosphotransferase
MEYKIIEKITVGGSDRIFYRCAKDTETFILVWDKNIKPYMALHKHLSNRGINVPELYWADENTNLLVIEDLGKNSLFELTKKRKNIYPYYRYAIKELIKLQIDGYFDVPTKALYDREHIKWEQDYFKQYLLVQQCKIPKKTLKKLDNDLKKLRQELMTVAEPWCNFFMHRDYQSKNIYIKNKRAIIIDFQSARIGPLTYDLAALLRDPYVKISKEKEAKLIDYYLACLKKKGVRCEKREFMQLYNLTALQRNMQSLGAFANLSLNKDKPHFKQYIPRGLQLLQAGLKKSKFKDLYDIVTSKEVCQRCRFQPSKRT